MTATAQTETRRPAIRYLTNAAGIKGLAATAEAHGWDWYESPIDRRNDKLEFRVFAPSAEAFAAARESKPTYKFAKTYCSQCGGEFGPGNHGFSMCRDHRSATA